MLEWCQQHQIASNSKECIFCAPFEMLLGHIVCKEGPLVYLANIALIVNFPPPTNMKQLKETLGHKGYYCNFIGGYVAITSSMKNLLKKDAQFEWSHECQGSIDILKKKMVTTPILVFPDWTKKFHVDVDVSSFAMGVVLAQPNEGNIDHPIVFSSRKLSSMERNYKTMMREGLEMVYTFQYVH